MVITLLSSCGNEEESQNLQQGSDASDLAVADRPNMVIDTIPYAAAVRHLSDLLALRKVVDSLSGAQCASDLPLPGTFSVLSEHVLYDAWMLAREDGFVAIGFSTKEGVYNTLWHIEGHSFFLFRHDEGDERGLESFVSQMKILVSDYVRQQSGTGAKSL